MQNPLNLDPLFDTSLRARFKRVILRIINTRYLFIAFLIHMLALALLGSKVLVDTLREADLRDPEGLIVMKAPDPGPQEPVQVREPPAGTSSTAAPTVLPGTPGEENPILKEMIENFHGASWNPPPSRGPGPILESVGPHSNPGLLALAEAAEWERLKQVAKNQKTGITGKDGRPGVTIVSTQSDGRVEIIARFSCYVLQYEGGDWNCNLGRLAENRWYGNCVHNLMVQIERWTKGKVKAELKPEYLKLASREWLEKVQPPFVFMTGHGDFTFSPVEVENLRNYLMGGGLLWVDNSLPGRKSRFDIALRRELRKVMPERIFEPIGIKHPVFHTHFNFAAVPKGMNFYDEPVEVINIGGVAAVFYTLNAYSDLWETALTAKDEVDVVADWLPSVHTYIHRTGPHYGGGSYRFFRNVNRGSVVESYKLGINIVFHLLTRYQEKIRFLPNARV